MILEASDVTVRLGCREVVSGASLRAESGCVIGVLGPNGAGKTSLLKALAGVLPCEGTLTLEGRPLSSLGDRIRARSLAYLPQGVTAHWPLAVRDIVMLGRLPHGNAWGMAPSAADGEAVSRALRETNITALAERPFDRLSGGEKARVLLARALAVQAPVLLADEPVAHLDPGQQLHVMDLLRRRAAQGDAVVVVAHDLALASRTCDQVVLMREGRIFDQGAPRAVMTDDALRAVYGVEVARGCWQGRDFLLPWRSCVDWREV